MTGTSPPGPFRCGSVTWSTSPVATAASNALPPCSSTAMPAAEASQCVDATMPKVPASSGRVVNSGISPMAGSSHHAAPRPGIPQMILNKYSCQLITFVVSTLYCSYRVRPSLLPNGAWCMPQDLFSLPPGDAEEPDGSSVPPEAEGTG